MILFGCKNSWTRDVWEEELKKYDFKEYMHRNWKSNV